MTFLVFILRCGLEGNTRRLLGRSSRSKSRLTDAKVLEEVGANHFVYYFFARCLGIAAGH